MPSEIVRRAVIGMDGLRGCPRGDAAIEKRGEAFDRILNLRKCLNAEAVDRAITRIVDECDEFPTPRQFADMVQSCMGNKTSVVDPVYIAQGGYAWVCERAYAQYNCYTIYAELQHAEKEAATQTNVIFGNVTGGTKAAKGNLGDFL